MSPLNRLVFYLLKGYKKYVSPLLPPACRFTPSCSEYAMICFQRFSFMKATLLTLLRILRCNPLFEGGEDPVPQKKN